MPHPDRQSPNGISLSLDEEAALLELMEHERHCVRMKVRGKRTHACRLEVIDLGVVTRLVDRGLIDLVPGGFGITERGIHAVYVPPGPAPAAGGAA